MGPKSCGIEVEDPTVVYIRSVRFFLQDLTIVWGSTSHAFSPATPNNYYHNDDYNYHYDSRAISADAINIIPIKSSLSLPRHLATKTHV